MKEQMALELGQRVYDESWKEFGVVIVRKVGEHTQILDGYQDNEEVLDWVFAVDDEDDRLLFLEKSGVTYTYVNDDEVTEIND